MAVRFELKKSLEDYFEAGDSNTKEFLADKVFVAAVNRTYEFFASELFVKGNGLKAAASVLALNSFMLWMASLRMALTGHAAASFPLFRTALESACYGYLIQKDEAKERLWLARHSSEKDTAACRGAFTPAVREVAKAINTVQPGSGDIILQIYENAIDYGAHPNTKSVLPNLRSEPDTDPKFWRLQLVGVHNHNDTEARRSLLAALEYAWVIALIIFRTIDQATEAQVTALEEMNDLKAKLVGEWFVVDGGEEAVSIGV